jgi:hypothetical protein
MHSQQPPIPLLSKLCPTSLQHTSISLPILVHHPSKLHPTFVPNPANPSPNLRLHSVRRSSFLRPTSVLISTVAPPKSAFRPDLERERERNDLASKSSRAEQSRAEQSAPCCCRPPPFAHSPCHRLPLFHSTRPPPRIPVSRVLPRSQSRVATTTPVMGRTPSTLPLLGFVWFSRP